VAVILAVVTNLAWPPFAGPQPERLGQAQVHLDG